MGNYELNVDQIFSNNMILPAGKSFRVAGTGFPGTTIKVKIGSAVQRAIVNRHGEWQCRFEPIIDTQRIFEVHIEDQKQRITLKNVRFGRVLLVAGQSNIGFRMSQDRDFKTELEHFNLSQISYYNAPQPSFIYQNGKVEEYQSHATHWHQLKTTNLSHVSAIAFYAAQRLIADDPNVPVGIVCCTKDGALAPTWIAESTLRSQPELLEKVVRPFETEIKAKTEENLKEDIQLYRAKVQRHNRRMYNFMKANPTVPMGVVINVVGQTPWPPPVTPESYLKPGSLFKAMVLRLRHYTFDQMVWYQGETDIEDRDIYDVLLTSLVNDWRRVFRDYSLPVYIMQLPKYAKVQRNAWAQIRQQQLKVVENLANMHLVSIADTGELYNPHPIAKKEVGIRLGRILAGEDYAATPSLATVQVVKNQVNLKFKYVKKIQVYQSGLIEALVDNTWQTIPVQINTNQLQVQVPPATTQLRYGYSNTPTLTFFNENQDPLSPFLIDLKTAKLI